MNQTNNNIKGLTGLMNLGNTCFINSCFQILNHTYELDKYLNDENVIKKINNIIDSVLLIEWINLRKIMWNENCVIYPLKFIKTIQEISKIKDSVFNNFEQSDFGEFLIFVLNCFHNSLSRSVNVKIYGESKNEIDDIALKCYKTIEELYSKEYSEICELFYGILVTKIEKNSNNKIMTNIIPETFSILSLPIPNIQNPSLFDCLNLYIQEEILDGDNGLINDETKEKETIIKNTYFWSLPKILVIELKRYDFNNNKNDIFINFLLENFDISNYVIGYNNLSYVYDLYAICNHVGSSNNGHYFCHIKINGNWYIFDDNNVILINDISKIITNNAYCLFYRKKYI